MDSLETGWAEREKSSTAFRNEETHTHIGTAIHQPLVPSHSLSLVVFLLFGCIKELRAARNNTDQH